MRMTEGVEWATHCCTLLAVLPLEQTLAAADLAQFHDVPPAYLAKHLQALVAAGLAAAVTGPRGGYRLAKPADDITLLDIVLAVDGDGTAFRCSEIRRRGPSGVGDEHYQRACGIARAMWRAEDAWRTALANVSLADLVEDMFESVSARQLDRGAEWVERVSINRRTRQPRQPRQPVEGSHP
jgi:Rrf2 family protein